MTASYGLRWLEGEPAQDGNAELASFRDGFDLSAFRESDSVRPECGGKLM
jgi:hypothetical protein